MKVKRYKFQALVTFTGPPEQAPVLLPDGNLHRIVVRGQHHGTHGSQVFSALVSSRDSEAVRLDPGRELVTVQLVGDDCREYFDVGDEFSLWLGHEVGTGVVTRRLFI